MRVSLKLNQEEDGEDKPQQLSLLLRTKLPISIFNLPFLSSLSLSSLSPSSPTLSLQTHSPNGPSFKLSYTPSSPLTLSLSSGVSLSSSPIHSPLTVSAHFSLYPFNHSPSPTFSLLINPTFGDFFIKKSIFSSPENPKSLDSHRVSDLNGFEPIEPLGSLKDSNLVPTQKKSGVSVWARSVVPVTKRVTVRFRWGVNFPSDIRKGLPFLSLDKVAIERAEEERGGEERETDFEALRGMCASVGREVEDLRRENREMRRCFDEMIRKVDSGYRYSDGVSKRVAKPLMVSEDLGEIEGWNKLKKKVVGKEVKSDLNGVNKEVKSNTNGANKLESEFQRAIMAASASQ